MEDLRKRIKELEIELEVEKKKNEIIQEYANYALWEYDIETKCLVLSKKLNGRYSKYNMTIDHYQKTMHEWNLVHPDDWDVFDRYCLSMDSGEKTFQYDIRQITDEAIFVWLRYIGEAIYNEENVPIKIVGKTIDVSEEKKNERELTELAQRDSLTNLYNKEATRKHIQKFIYNSNSRDLGGAFFIIDIDDFKSVNDTWGHLYGDFVLQQVANILTMCSTVGDIAGRIGGDEFCLFCKSKKGLLEISKIATEILERANGTKMREDMKLRLSIGIAIFPQQACDYEDLYRYADMALYEAKNQGKNEFRFYNEEMEYCCQASQKSQQRRTTDSNSKRKQQHDMKIINFEDSVQNQLYFMDKILEMNKMAYYIVEENSLKILEVNHKIRHMFPHYKKQTYCYESIFDRESPCDYCPLKMNVKKEESFSVEIFHNITNCFYDVKVLEFQDSEKKTYYLLSWRDMSDWAEKIGTLDELTGALNYGEFYQKIIEELNYSADSHTLVMIGIYDFYRFNEIYGIESSNELLKKLVAFLSQNLSRGEYVCRIKGDDVYLFLNENKQDAKGRVERLIMTFEALMAERYLQCRVQLFAGICYMGVENQFSARTFDVAKSARSLGKKYLCKGNPIGERWENEEILDV